MSLANTLLACTGLFLVILVLIFHATGVMSD